MAKRKNNLQRNFGIIIVIIIALSIFIYSNFISKESLNTLSSIPSLIEQPEEVGEDKVTLEKHTKGTDDSSYIPQTTFAFTFWGSRRYRRKIYGKLQLIHNQYF